MCVCARARVLCFVCMVVCVLGGGGFFGVVSWYLYPSIDFDRIVIIVDNFIVNTHCVWSLCVE